MFEILESYMIVPNMHLLTISAPNVIQEMQPGQFIILRAEENGERIPLSVADWDVESGTVTTIFMNVGRSTDTLASLEAGMKIPTVVGPLGTPTEIDKFGTVLCLGGCYGIGSIYPIIKALKKKKNDIIAVIEARSSYLLYWEEKLKEAADKIFYITRDGTRGLKGHVNRLNEIIKAEKPPVDRVIINGCTYLLRKGSEVTGISGIKTIVSLNPIMIDGTGMCGVCRVSVDETTKFACVDGPDFDGHLVDWDELLQRRYQYFEEEIIPLQSSRCEEHAIKHKGRGNA